MTSLPLDDDDCFSFDNSGMGEMPVAVDVVGGGMDTTLKLGLGRSTRNQLKSIMISAKSNDCDDDSDVSPTAEGVVVAGRVVLSSFSTIWNSSCVEFSIIIEPFVIDGRVIEFEFDVVDNNNNWMHV